MKLAYLKDVSQSSLIVAINKLPENSLLEYIEELVAQGFDLASGLKDYKYKRVSIESPDEENIGEETPAIVYILESGNKTSAKLFWKVVDHFKINLKANEFLASKALNAGLISSSWEEFLKEWVARELPIKFNNKMTALGSLAGRAGIAERAIALTGVGASFLEINTFSRWRYMGADNVALTKRFELNKLSPPMPTWLYVLSWGDETLTNLMIKEFGSSISKVISAPIENIRCVGWSVGDEQDNYEFPFTRKDGTYATPKFWFVTLLKRHAGSKFQKTLWENVFPLFNESDKNFIFFSVCEFVNNNTLKIHASGVDTIMNSSYKNAFKDCCVNVLKGVGEGKKIPESSLLKSCFYALREFPSDFERLTDIEKDNILSAVISFHPGLIECTKNLGITKKMLGDAILNRFMRSDFEFTGVAEMNKTICVKVAKIFKELMSGSVFDKTENDAYIKNRTTIGFLSESKLLREFANVGLLRKEVLKERAEPLGLWPMIKELEHEMLNEKFIPIKTNKVSSKNGAL